MRKAAWILLALLALRLLPRALRREKQMLKLVLTLFEVVSLAAITNTSKTVATEQRVGAVETRVGTAEDNIATAQATANAALPKSGGTVSGNLTVTGNMTANGDVTAFGSCGVHQNATVLGTLGVQGSTTLSSLETTGGTTVDGNLGTFGTLTVSAGAGFHSNVTILGTLNGHAP